MGRGRGRQRHQLELFDTSWEAGGGRRRCLSCWMGACSRDRDGETGALRAARGLCFVGGSCWAVCLPMVAYESLFSHCDSGTRQCSGSFRLQAPMSPQPRRHGPLGSEPDTDNQKARASLCDRAPRPISALETREVPSRRAAWGRMTAGKNVISSKRWMEFQIQHRPHSETWNLDTLPHPPGLHFQFRSRMELF